MDDMWRLNPQGADFIGGSGEQKKLAVPEVNVIFGVTWPSARINATSWVDLDGNLWMYGGLVVRECYKGYSSEMWNFDVTSQIWTVYNPLTQLNAGGTAVQPSNRANGVGWLDSTTGLLWMFAGDTTFDELKDLWTFSIQDKAWTLIKSDDHSATFFYGAYAWEHNGTYFYISGYTVFVFNQTSQLWTVPLPGAPQLPMFPAKWTYSDSLWLYGSDNSTFLWTLMGNLTVSSQAMDLPSQIYASYSWVNANGTFFMLDGLNATGWYSSLYTIDPQTYSSVHLTKVPIPPLPRGATQWNAHELTYLFGGAEGSDENLSTSYLWQIDPCSLDNGGCPADQICTSRGKSSLYCTYEPLVYFPFSGTFKAETAVYLTQSDAAFTSTDCGMGLAFGTSALSMAAFPPIFTHVNFTIAMWIYNFSSTSQDTPFMQQSNIDCSSDYWRISANQSTIKFSLAQPASAVSISIEGDAPGRSFHLAITGTYSVGLLTVSMYINGRSAAQPLNTPLKLNTTGTMLYLGNVCGATPPTLVLDELAFFQREISPASVMNTFCDKNARIQQCGFSYKLLAGEVKIGPKIQVSGMLPCVTLLMNSYVTFSGGSIVSSSLATAIRVLSGRVRIFGTTFSQCGISVEGGTTQVEIIGATFIDTPQAFYGISPSCDYTINSTSFSRVQRAVQITTGALVHLYYNHFQQVTDLAISISGIPVSNVVGNVFQDGSGQGVFLSSATGLIQNNQFVSYITGQSSFAMNSSLLTVLGNNCDVLDNRFHNVHH
eukprot:Phypoly_transcript_00313.p1 GENE.Phypoly_transcript_00313~~Phypoly_transcript_00313.p1  ORF type:complete len:769 (+),score=53.66 Phypoly_transcript_00313:120-2426(+)